jgi:hypothetical protein
MKRVMLYQVDSDGHVSPIYSAVVVPSRRRVVLPAYWVESLGVGLLVVALFCLPSLLYSLLEFILGGSK